MTTMKFAEINIQMIREPLMVLDEELRVMSVNLPFYQWFHLSPDKVIHKLFYDIDRGAWSHPSLRERLEDVLTNNSTFHNLLVLYHSTRIEKRVLKLNARCLEGEHHHPRQILLVIEEVLFLEEKSQI